MFARFSSAFLIVLAMLCGCDQRPNAGLPNQPEDSNFTDRYSAELSVVTPLAPRRSTHVAVDPGSGNLYFAQESDNGDDVMFVAGASDVPRATGLSSANIVAAAGAAAGDKGNIRAIAVGPVGEIYFFFLGGGKRRTVACFGRFLPRTGSIQILAGSDEIESASMMGRSIELADVSVVSSGKWIWLMLRHSDVGAMFCFDSRQFPPSGPIRLGKPTTEIHTAEGPLPLTRPDIALAPGLSNSALLRDLWSGAIWRISLQNDGELLCSIVGLSSAISLPGESTSRSGKNLIAMFASDGDPITPRVAERVQPPLQNLRYPAILLLPEAGSRLIAIPRDDIRAPAGYPLHAAQLQQLVYQPLPRDSFIGFDSASGQIVRLKISAK